MKKLALKAVYVLIFISITANSQAQKKEGNFWHFGHGNELDFSSGVPVAVAGSQQSTFEGCASVCDADGNLLFYTNGGGRDPLLSGQSSGKIWNAQNAVVYDMGNTEGGGFSAAQSSVCNQNPAIQVIIIFLPWRKWNLMLGAPCLANRKEGDCPGLNLMPMPMVVRSLSSIANKCYIRHLMKAFVPDVRMGKIIGYLLPCWLWD